MFNTPKLLKMKQDSVILIRVVNGIGIDKKANGYLLDGTPVKRKVYNGRLCYQNGKIRVGYKTLSESIPVKIELNNFECPF